MPTVPLARGEHNKGTHLVPAMRCRNVYVDRIEGDPQSNYALFPTPGLRLFAELGVGPIRAIFQEEGVLEGRTIVVSGSEIYELGNTGIAVLIGAIAGNSGRVPIAASRTQLVFVSEGFAWVLSLVDGLYSLAQITDPDFVEVSDVVFINGYFLFTRRNSDEYVWSAINDATNYDALDFATAESSGDNAVAIVKDRNNPVIFGASTIERLRATGNADAPFVRLAGGVIEASTISRDSVVQTNNTVFYVSEDDNIYAYGASPEIISTPYIAEQLAKVPDSLRSDITGWAYSQRGHGHLVYDFPTVGTFSFSFASQQWSRRETRGQTLYRPFVHCKVFGENIVGDRVNGRVYILDTEYYFDDTVEIERTFTGAVFTGIKRGDPIYNFAVEGVKGQGRDGAATPGADPQVMLRYSKDGGKTFSNEDFASFGKIGEHDKRAIWRALGDAGAAGFHFELDLSDPVNWIITRMTINELE